MFVTHKLGRESPQCALNVVAQLMSEVLLRIILVRGSTGTIPPSCLLIVVSFFGRWSELAEARCLGWLSLDGKLLNATIATLILT